MQRLPSLAAIRVFEAAARHENFTRAAAELGMTQAAVSYQIRVLEQQLGIPLFLREGGRVKPTSEAVDVSRAVTKAFGTMVEAFARLRDLDESVLTISCGNTVATNWLASRLGRFQGLRPDLDVRLDITDMLVDFDKADVAIRATVRPAEHLYAKRLMPIVVMPMCSPAFLERHPIDVPSELLGVALLSPTDLWWARWFEQADVFSPGSSRSGMRLDSQIVEGAAAMAGNGVAILMPEMWQPDIAAGRLVPAFDLSADTGMALWFVCPDARRSGPKNKAFLAWLLSELQSEQVITANQC